MLGTLAMLCCLLLSAPVCTASVFGYFWSTPAKPAAPADTQQQQQRSKDAPYQVQGYSAVAAMFAEGRESHSKLQARQHDSPCWKAAYQELDVSCREMSHTLRQRLALSLANCHLQESSRLSFPCHPRAEIGYCLKELRDSTSFDVFTQFFMQVESTCYYLQSEQWQSSTENLIEDLGTAAKRTLVAQAEVHTALTDASAHLEGISEASQEVLAAQQQLQASMGAAETRAQAVADSIELARNDVAQLNSMLTTGMDALLQQQEAARAAIATLRAQLAATRQQLQQHARDSEAAHTAALARSAAVAATVDHIYSALSSAGSAWSTLSSYGYLALALILSWVITAIPALHAARTALYALTLAEVLLERVLLERARTSAALLPYALLLTQERMRQCGMCLAAAALALSALSFLLREFNAAFGSSSSSSKKTQYTAAAATADTAATADAATVTAVVAVTPQQQQQQQPQQQQQQQQNNLAPHFAAAAANDAIVGASPLTELSRRELQALAKQHGVPANIASTEIVVKLQELQVAQ